jgi:hypothetical protein
MTLFKLKNIGGGTPAESQPSTPDQNTCLAFCFANRISKFTCRQFSVKDIVQPKKSGFKMGAYQFVSTSYTIAGVF